MFTTVLLALAVLIIAGLSLYAFVLLRRVRMMQAEQARQEADERAKHNEQRTYLIESLRVISANVIDEDLNLSEATIRCKVLLDALLLPEHKRQPYEILDVVYDKIQHFATHSARKDLPREERRKQDQEREMIESRYQEELLSCFKSLREFSLQAD